MRLERRKFPFQVRFLFLQRSDIAVGILELTFGLIEHRHVERGQLRQRSIRLLLHHGKLRLQRPDFLSELLRFLFQEGSGLLRMPLTRFEVFSQK